MRKFICDKCGKEWRFEIEHVSVFHRGENKRFDICSSCRIDLDEKIKETTLNFFNLKDEKIERSRK